MPLVFGQCAPSVTTPPLKSSINKIPVSARTQAQLDSALMDLIRYVTRQQQETA